MPTVRFSSPIRYLWAHMGITRNGHPFVRYEPKRLSAEESLERGTAHCQSMEQRRSVRDFSDEAVPRSLIEQAILTASSAPSGAHQQPWTFVAVRSPELKRKIRIAAEEEEKTSYEGRMSEEWRKALEPIGTSHSWKRSRGSSWSSHSSTDWSMARSASTTTSKRASASLAASSLLPCTTWGYRH